MIELLPSLPDGLSAVAFWTLIVSSFIASLITVALGIGGGGLMLAIMASLVPPAALIAVHGVVQLGSNGGRAVMLWRNIHWAAVIPGFLIGSIAGSAMGGAVVIELPSSYVQIGVGAFVIYSVFAKPPQWLSHWSWFTGAVSSFLTMFFGATGLFVANYTKSFTLPRHDHVATHAALMTFQHGLKVIIFGLLGFAYSAWAFVIIALVIAGVAGTLAGRLVLNRITDHGFKRALDVILVLISLRLIWEGFIG